MSLTLIIAPTVLPVSVAELKLQLRVEHSEEDALLESYIKAAVRRAEHETGRALLSQTWELAIDAFPDGEIELPKPKVLSITSVKYIDTAGVEQTMSPSLYSLDAALLPGWLFPAVDTEWPDTDDVANAVKVRFAAGYGTSADDVPADVKLWITMWCAAAYRNREAFAQGVSVADLPSRYFDSMLDSERTYL